MRISATSARAVPSKVEVKQAGVAQLTAPGRRRRNVLVTPSGGGRQFLQSLTGGASRHSRHFDPERGRHVCRAFLLPHQDHAGHLGHDGGRGCLVLVAQVLVRSIVEPASGVVARRMLPLRHDGGPDEVADSGLGSTPRPHGGHRARRARNFPTSSFAFGMRGFICSRVSATICDTAKSRYHFRSAGMTCHGAWAVLHRASASS